MGIIEQSLKTAILKRNINYAVHFTKAENLESIFKHGLLPVQKLNEHEIDYLWNDELRLDNCPDATCLSIEFPNYKMFYKYRMQDTKTDWVVLGINRSVLWKKDCAFCFDNAASANVNLTPIEERKGVEAFELLYKQYPDKPSRDVLNIKKSYPTSPQAEILVFDYIKPKDIFGVAFQHKSTKKKYEDCIPHGKEVKVIPDYFRYRNDYDHWC